MPRMRMFRQPRVFHTSGLRLSMDGPRQAQEGRPCRRAEIGRSQWMGGLPLPKAPDVLASGDGKKAVEHLIWLWSHVRRKRAEFLLQSIGREGDGRAAGEVLDHLVEASSVTEGDGHVDAPPLGVAVT